MLYIFVFSASIFLSVRYGQSVLYECHQGISKSTCGYFYMVDDGKQIYKLAFLTQANKSFLVIVGVLLI